jgi:hypothetical protein
MEKTFMKSSVIVAGVAIAIAGCASDGPKKGEIPTIESQSFATNVPGETIKIDKKCGWLWNRKKCEVIGIEAVGVQPSVGATRLLQKTTTNMACDNARANVVGYVFGMNVTENRRTTSRSKQNENQKDRFKSATEIGPDVAMNPEDPNRDTNYSIREALIDSDIDSVKTVTVNAQGRLVGFGIVKTNLVDAKTVSCTIGWNKYDSNDLRQVRGLISGG